jgi:nitrogen fixation protein NifU and related proteins
MMEPKLYDDLLMDHIKNARNYLALEDANRKAFGTNPLCGDDLTVYVRLEGGRVEKVAFLCTCCGISMASASIMTESVRGMNASEAMALIRSFTELLALPARSSAVGASADHRAVIDAVRRYPVRTRCAMLPWMTLAAALEGREQASIPR